MATTIYNPEVIAARLRRLRDDNHLTIAEFCRKLGAPSTSVVFHWLNGKCAPSSYWLFHISRIFGVSTDWILGLTDERKRAGGWIYEKKNV